MKLEWGKKELPKKEEENIPRKMKTLIYFSKKISKKKWPSVVGKSYLIVSVTAALLLLNDVAGQRPEVNENSILDMGNNENRRPADFASNPFPNQFPNTNFRDPFQTEIFRTTEDPSRTTTAPTTPTPFRRTQQEINRYLNKEPVLSSFPEAPFNPNQGEYKIENFRSQSKLANLAENERQIC